MSPPLSAPVHAVCPTLIAFLGITAPLKTTTVHLRMKDPTWRGLMVPLPSSARTAAASAEGQDPVPVALKLESVFLLVDPFHDA